MSAAEDDFRFQHPAGLRLKEYETSFGDVGIVFCLNVKFSGYLGIFVILVIACHSYIIWNVELVIFTHDKVTCKYRVIYYRVDTYLSSFELGLVTYIKFERDIVCFQGIELAFPFTIIVWESVSPSTRRYIHEQHSCIIREYKAMLVLECSTVCATKKFVIVKLFGIGRCIKAIYFKESLIVQSYLLHPLAGGKSPCSVAC